MRLAGSRDEFGSPADPRTLMLDDLLTLLDGSRSAHRAAQMQVRMGRGAKAAAEEEAARADRSLAVLRSKVAVLPAEKRSWEAELLRVHNVVAADPYGDQTGYCDALCALMDFRIARNAGTPATDRTSTAARPTTV